MATALPELAESAEARPISLPQRAIRYGRRAPGQLTMLLTVLVLLCLGTGLACVLDIQHRRAALAGIAERGGPLTGAAEELYQSLSDADATAANAFLSVGNEPPALRERYQANVTEAAAALTTAAAGSPTGQSAGTIAELTAYLPVYTGLIETARTMNRQGLPQGVSYLREASGLVQLTMLPKAQALYRAESGRLAAAQAGAGSFAWFPLVLGILTVGALVAAQIFLSRTTNRVFNAGLLATTAAVLVALLWFAIGSGDAASRASAGRTDGTAQIEALAQARIAASQARSDESLTLVARGNGAEYEKHFGQTSQTLDGAGGLLAQARNAVAQNETRDAVDAAVRSRAEWLTRHRQLRTLDDGGGYNEAIRYATVDPAGTQPVSTDVDTRLGEAIRQATDRFADRTAAARGALTAVDGGMIILSVLAVLGLALGFAPRLREFR